MKLNKEDKLAIIKFLILESKKPENKNLTLKEIMKKIGGK